MAKGYVPIFFDWLETTQDLAAEEKGNLIDAVVAYAAGLEYEHLLNGATRIAFRFLKGQVDRNAAIADVRRQNREGKSNNNKQEQNTTNDNKTEEGATNNSNNKNNKKDIKNDNHNNSNNNGNGAQAQKRFQPPDEDEVALYCIERGNHVNAHKFFDYYTANGWKVGKNQMKDWKAAVRTWERNSWTEEEYRKEMENSDLPW